MGQETPVNVHKGRILIMLFLICAGSGIAVWLHWPFAVGFFPGLLFLIFLARTEGMSWKVLKTSAFKGIRQIEEIIWLLPLIGLLIPAWTASGVIPYLMGLGISAIQPKFFVASSFIVAGITSMLLGTTLGTLSVIGIPIIGIARACGLPIHLVAGALVSGAVVGDRSSPMSGTFNLLATSCGINPHQHFRALLPTGLIGLIITVLFFLILDFTGNGFNLQVENTQSLSSYFFMSPFLLLAPLVLLTCIGLKMKMRYSFIFGIAASIVLGFLLHNTNPGILLSYMLTGYTGPGPEFLHSAGLVAMLPMALFVVEIGAFNGVLLESGLISDYVQRILGSSPSMARYTYRTIVFGILLDVLVCNQTLPVVLSSSSLLPNWSRQFKNSHLSRVIADSVQLAAAIIPWNLMAVLISTIIGVRVWDYLPYAAYIWSLPLVTLAFSFCLEKTGSQN